MTNGTTAGAAESALLQGDSRFAFILIHHFTLRSVDARNENGESFLWVCLMLNELGSPLHSDLK